MPEALGTDYGIPSLPAALDPLILKAHLASISLWPRQMPGLLDLQVRILKLHQESRCTLVIDVMTGAGPHRVIGKVYARRRPDVFCAMQRISQAGFGPADAFSIPLPLAYIPELNLLLQEHMAGPLAKEFFVGHEDERFSIARRCALWLARYHAVGPRAGSLCKPESLLVSMGKWTRALSVLGGHAANWSAALLKLLQSAASSLQHVERRAGHASYSPAQVMLVGLRTAVFDWDGYDIADPARDLARFGIALRRLALARLGSISALAPAEREFYGAYAAAAPPDASANLRFYQAATCLQLARYHLVHQVPQWGEKLEALLLEGLRVLEVG